MKASLRKKDDLLIFLQLSIFQVFGMQDEHIKNEYEMKFDFSYEIEMCVIACIILF